MVFVVFNAFVNYFFFFKKNAAFVDFNAFFVVLYLFKFCTNTVCILYY